MVKWAQKFPGRPSRKSGRKSDLYSFKFIFNYLHIFRRVWFEQTGSRVLITIAVFFTVSLLCKFPGYRCKPQSSFWSTNGAHHPILSLSFLSYCKYDYPLNLNRFNGILLNPEYAFNKTDIILLKMLLSNVRLVFVVGNIEKLK